MKDQCSEHHVRVAIRFEGICVNLQKKDHPSLPCKHRVVVPNIRGVRDVWGNEIDSHAAGYTFTLDSGGENEKQLDGATLRIANACGDQVDYDDSYSHVPSLTATVENAGGTLGPVNPVVVGGEDAAVASCYFDVDQGTISACLSAKGSAVTTIEIDCHGEPELEIIPFPRRVPIPTREVYIWNESDSPGGPQDFLLSYLIAEHPPENTPPIPSNPSGRQCPPGKTRKEARGYVSTGGGVLADYVDIGCSNSTYP